MDIPSASEVQVEVHQLAADKGFPNNPTLPLLVYRRVLSGCARDAVHDVERLFTDNGWQGAWHNGVYTYHHYHSNTHEVLGVCEGRAQVQFGGPSGPIVDVQAGDVAILPAGTGHKCVNASNDFLVVGAYPVGQEEYDLLRGDPKEQAAAAQRIAAVPLPEADPVYGAGGPLREYWSR